MHSYAESEVTHLQGLGQQPDDFANFQQGGGRAPSSYGGGGGGGGGGYQGGGGPDGCLLALQPATKLMILCYL